MKHILLSPDATEGIDPMDTKVNDIDTSFPRLPAGLYDLKIVSAKKEPSKKGGKHLTIVFETTDKQKSTSGEDIQPGHKITHRIGLTERSEEGKSDYTIAKIAKGIAAVTKAARINTTPGAIRDNPAQLEGAVLRCKVKISKETAEFPESNNIGEFVVIK